MPLKTSIRMLDRGLNVGLSHHGCSYFVYTNSKALASLDIFAGSNDYLLLENVIYLTIYPSI